MAQQMMAAIQVHAYGGADRLTLDGGAIRRWG